MISPRSSLQSRKPCSIDGTGLELPAAQVWNHHVKILGKGPSSKGRKKTDEEKVAGGMSKKFLQLLSPPGNSRFQTASCQVLLRVLFKQKNSSNTIF